MRKQRKRSRRSDAVIAYHEAGHAIVSWSLHLKPRRVTIIPDDESAGHVLNRAINKRTSFEIEWADRFSLSRLTAEKHTMIAMAGELAQRRFDPRSWRSYHGSTDRHNVVNFLMRYAPYRKGAIDITAHYKLLREWACEMLERQWYLVEAVADELVKRRTLSHNELREVILNAQDQKHMLPIGSSIALARSLNVKRSRQGLTQYCPSERTRAVSSK